MEWLKFGICAYLVTVLQTSAVPVLAPEWFCPHLLVVLAVYEILVSNSQRGVAAAIICGLLADLTSITPLGSQIFSFGLIAAVIRALKPMMFHEKASAHGFAGGLGYLTLVTTYYLVTLISLNAVPLNQGVWISLSNAIATGLVSAVVCKLLVTRPKPGTMPRLG